MKTATLFATLAFVTALAAQQDPTEFPLRSKFPELGTITTSELASLKDAIVVDSRNKMEFDVIHVEGAVNLLVGDMKKADLQAVREPNGTRTLVFYCNGVTCPKSYQAAEKARVWGFQNCKVYDAGIFAWAEQRPGSTRFFGELLTPETAKQKLISKAELKKASVTSTDFIAKAQSGEYKVYDVRDTKERQEFPIKLPKLAKLSMDEFVEQLTKGGVPAQKVLILDNVGKQVEWLQYYLRKAGHGDHAFLLGGVEQWRKEGFDGNGVAGAKAAPAK